ncbi:MAG: transketolase, partial [Rhodospirillaceae bacterium]|nr:transketolase [Rhodospirillaceae bacterium]
QGLANAVGMALAERLMAARFGDDMVDHHTYAVVGDGCLMEGISHEAISLAGHLKLGKLIVLFDDNRISIDGPTDLSVSDDQAARFAASGWDAEAVDGHDGAAVSAAIARAKKTDRPSLILCRTTIGYGAPGKAGTAGSHGAPLGAEEIAGARAAYGWNAEPFELPDDIIASWRAIGAKGAETNAGWAKRRDALPGARKAEFERTVAGCLPEGLDDAIRAYKKALSDDAPKRATRQSSGETLDILAEHLPELIGGSADLTGSNNTKAKSQGIVSAEDFSGGYIHYGVREHAMAAAMNGMALHGGLIPYGGTFLIFTDYARPAMRLSALMGVRAIYVMTHDSIGLGEDGPTHQPVEQIASLRAMPNMAVFRPADAVETAECWALALARKEGPSTLALTRQGLPTLRTAHTDENLCARGAYVLAEANGPARVTLYATGSEVSLAVEAQAMLEGEGVPTRVVSIPSRELFEAQDESYKSNIVDPGHVRVAVEAAIGFGWDRFVGADGAFIGMTGFGASAPAGALYRHFGITAEAVAEAARVRL